MDKVRPAVFLDRDGVLTVEEKRIVHPAQVKLYKDAAENVRRLKDKGFLVIVISNQSGVARGLFSEEELCKLHDRLKSETGVDGIYYCPHHLEGAVKEYAIECDCRKPKTGMIDKARADHSIDMSRSWMVGDRESDILTGRNAGIRTILVRAGYGEDDIKRGVSADVVLDDLSTAVDYIIRNT